MKFKEFKEIFTMLYEQEQAQNKYIDSIPKDIRVAFFDNAYVESLQTVNNFLLEKLLPENLQMEVDYWLYEDTGEDSLANMLQKIKENNEWS